MISSHENHQNSLPLLDPKLLETLIDKAFEVKQNSYSPYSKFRVGSALLTEDDKIIVGTNVENCSYGLTMYYYFLIRE